MNDFAQEKWTSHFKSARKNRFIEEDGPGYVSRLAGGRFELELLRPHLFAWAENPFYQYRDFVLEAEASFGEDTAYGSLGFCFRQMDETNYYYFLISNRGYFRFDLVFNGGPEILIPWTPFVRKDSTLPLHFRIIAHGSRFLFFIDEEWVGEYENEGIASGGFAWAGQNYGEGDRALLALHRMSLESRPVEVEAAYYRWGQYLPVEPDARFRLAESLYTAGAFSAVLVQMRRIALARSLTPQELRMVLRSQLGSGLYLEVLDWVPRLWKSAPEDSEWVEIQGIALYKLNRFTELKELLQGQQERVQHRTWYWGLRGNTDYALGNWAAAVEAYEKALEVQPDEPLYWENLGRARRLLKEGRKATEAQLTAAAAYFRQGDYGEAKALLPAILKAEPLNRAARILEGKLYFQDGTLDKAEVCFASLLEEGCDDSSVRFLQGLIRSSRGDKKQARELLLSAADGEPGEFVYQFKAAEFLHSQGEDMDPYLSRALSLEEDPWALNLAGLAALEGTDREKALEPLSRAVELAPDEASLAVNLALALDVADRTEEALELLRAHKGAEAANMRGNLLVHLKRHQEAVEAYREALKEEPRNRTYRINFASASLEADQIHQAEEALAVLEEETPSSEVRNLLGNIARLKGEFLRAETAYESALDLDSGNHTALINLADLQAHRGKFVEARAALDRLPRQEYTPRALRLEQRLKRELEEHFSCGSCDRTWTVPRNLPDQGGLRLRGEVPDEAPAGRCEECGFLLCVGCAKPYLSDGRFICPECGGKLKLSDNSLRFLLKQMTGLDEETKDTNIKK